MDRDVIVLGPGEGRAYEWGAMRGVFKADGEERRTLTTPDFSGVVEHCAVMGVVVAGAVTWLSAGPAGT